MVTADLNKYSLKTMPRPSAVYNISEATTAYLPQLIKLQKESGIKEFAIAILNGVKCFNVKELTREQLTQALKSHKTRKTENSPLKPLSTANSMISRRIKELESLGCVKGSVEKSSSTLSLSSELMSIAALSLYVLSLFLSVRFHNKAFHCRLK